MKQTKKLLSLLLTLVMVLGMLSGPVLALEEASVPAAEELNTAFAAVNEALEDGDVQAGINALDEYIAVYNSLSPVDQEANVEALAEALAYRELLEGSLAGIPDPEVNLLYDTYTSKITLYPSGATPTGVKMSVGDTWDRIWVVTAISKSSVTFGCKGQHNNGFLIPEPGYIWEGVTHAYNTVCSGSAFSNKPSVGANGQVLYSGGSATYSNLKQSSGDSTTGDYIIQYDKNCNDTVNNMPAPHSENKSYGSEKSRNINLASNYPTRDGYTFLGWREDDTGDLKQPGVNVYLTLGTHTFYAQWKPNTVAYTYQMTWNYNGGKVGSDSSRTMSETTERGTHTFYEDTWGYGSPQPERGGYQFKGWTYSGNGQFTSTNGQVNMTGAAGQTVSGTLTAVWEATTPPTPVTADYTVDWYDVAGEKLRETETRKGTVGEPVSVTSRDKELKNYIFDADNQGNITSETLAARGTELRLYFVRAITVTWLTEDGTQIKEVTIPADEDYADMYPVAPSESGKWGEPVADGDGNITIQWEKPEPAEYKVTVKYVDEKGEVIEGYPEVTVDTTGGGEYDVADKKVTIGGYTFQSADKPLSGIVTEDTVVTLTYKKDTPPVVPEPAEYKVTVRYVDEKGAVIEGYPEVTVDTTEGGKYDVADKKVTIGGYTFQSADKPLSGTVTENTTITLTYKKDTTPPPVIVEPDPDYYTLTIRYVYADGTTARPTVTRTRMERGDRYSVTSPVIEGYTADLPVAQGVMPARNETVTVTYTAEEDVEETDPPLGETPESTESPGVTETAEPIGTSEPQSTEPQPPEEAEELEDNDTPLSELPDEGEDLEDNDTPLAEVPQTGDELTFWLLMTLCSAAGLVCFLPRKRGKRVA